MNIFIYMFTNEITIVSSLLGFVFFFLFQLFIIISFANFILHQHHPKSALLNPYALVSALSLLITCIASLLLSFLSAFSASGRDVPTPADEDAPTNLSTGVESETDG